jgi:hypothetical protein
MLNEVQLRFAIEDARTRHEAVVNLIYQTDQQAVSLLSLFVTLALATASGFVGSLVKPPVVPAGFTVPLLVATLGFLVGAYMCFRTLETAMINLPGREAKFWTWANGEGVTGEMAFGSYLENLQSKTDQNNKLNATTSKSLRWARRFGIAAPLLSLLVAMAMAIPCP